MQIITIRLLAHVRIIRRTNGGSSKAKFRFVVSGSSTKDVFVIDNVVNSAELNAVNSADVKETDMMVAYMVF